MKNLKHNLFVLFLFFALPFFASGTKDTLYVVEIDAEVLIVNDQNESAFYNIELMCNNKLVESIKIVDNESFLLKIKKNALYTVRITKEGYSPVSININTKLPANNTSHYTFHFNAELIPVNTQISAEDPLNPATIAFNKTTDAFAFNEKR